MAFNGYEGYYLINDKELVNQIYLNKNKIIDKQARIQETFSPLTGASILFQESNENWKQKRKVLS